MEVVADRVSKLINTLTISQSQRMVLLEAVSDLRAAFCSFCNKSIFRDSSGRSDADPAGLDEFQNKKYKCNLCCAVKYQS